jgi:hypothetical protein
MGGFGISTQRIHAEKNLYTGSDSKIRIENKLSNEFPVSKRLRQRCCISPTLFNIYLQSLRHGKENVGTWVIPTGDNVYMFQSADQLITAQDLEETEYLTRKIMEEYKKMGTRN